MIARQKFAMNNRKRWSSFECMRDDAHFTDSVYICLCVYNLSIRSSTKYLEKKVTLEIANDITILWRLKNIKKNEEKKIFLIALGNVTIRRIGSVVIMHGRDFFFYQFVALIVDLAIAIIVE